MRILIDSNLFRHGARQVSYLAGSESHPMVGILDEIRTADHLPDEQHQQLRREIPYLWGLCRNGSQIRAEFFECDFGSMEWMTIPRTFGVGTNDVRKMLNVSRLETGLLKGFFSIGAQMKRNLHAHLASLSDPRLQEFRSALQSPKSGNDAALLFATEMKDMNYLLTGDFRLQRRFRQVKKQLRCRFDVLVPSELASLLGVSPSDRLRDRRYDDHDRIWRQRRQ